MAKLTRNTAGAAISAARIAARDKYVYRALLDRADNISADGTTLAIPDRMQPSGQHDTWIFGVSRRNVQRALAHLRAHGWVAWVLKPRGGEGRPPCHYTLLIGSDCDCTPVVKRQDGAQLGPSKAPGKAPETTEFSASVKRQTAGQAAFSPKGKEGPRRGGVAVDSPLADCAVCGSPLDPVLSRNGYRTHPCCRPDEKPDKRLALATGGTP